MLITGALHKEFVTVGLDRETARSVGLPIFWLDMALYAMVTIAIVISIQAVGNILVLALLITPAACARLLTDRIGRMMLIAPLIGAFSGLTGLYLSYAFNLAAAWVDRAHGDRRVPGLLGVRAPARPAQPPPQPDRGGRSSSNTVIPQHRDSAQP